MIKIISYSCFVFCFFKKKEELGVGVRLGGQEEEGRSPALLRILRLPVASHDLLKASEPEATTDLGHPSNVTPLNTFTTALTSSPTWSTSAEVRRGKLRQFYSNLYSLHTRYKLNYKFDGFTHCFFSKRKIFRTTVKM